MAVYVDDMYTIALGKFRRMKMSHLGADTTAELLEFVDRIGVQRKWIQSEGKPTEHFDIAMGKRALAIKAGAIPVSMRTLAPAMVHRAGPNAKIEINLDRGRIAPEIDFTNE